MIIENEALSNYEDPIFLRRMRNEVVGSLENKLDSLQNGSYTQILNYYISIADQSPSPSQEILNLLTSIIDSFIISHPKLQASIPTPINTLYTSLSSKTIKLISLYTIDTTNYSLFENLFRLLANLQEADLFTIDQSFTSFISSIDKYALNDILFQSICVIITKVCANSYYNHLIISNQVLLDMLINKFYSSISSIILMKSLLHVLSELTHKDSTFAEKLYEKDIGLFNEKLSNGIRLCNTDIKLLHLELMTNILIHGGQRVSSLLMKEPIVMWSISILLNMFKANGLSMKMKIESVTVLGVLLKHSVEFQDKMINLEGIELLMKELRLLYNNIDLKEIDEKVKILKANKEKKAEKIEKAVTEKEEDEIISNESALDEKNEYKKCIIECLAYSALQRDEARKKLITTKEHNIMTIILFIISDPNHHRQLLYASALLILSISRGHISVKKTLIDYDITLLLFKLTTHSSVDVKIQVTNSLCNFLYENPNSNSEIDYCINNLLKIFNTTSHQKIRFNAICAIKNIFYSVPSSKEIKKLIMKKMTYQTLLSLLDYEDLKIQEQALLIFRVLLFKTSDDIEEVFSNCKDSLLANIQKKLETEQSIDIVVQALYVISSISTGNSKQKSVIDRNMIMRIINYGYSPIANVRLVCTIILNNLLTSTDTQKIFLEDINLKPLLDILAFKDSDNNPDEVKEIKTNAMNMLSVIERLKKETNNK